MTTANNKLMDDNVAFRHNITAGDNVASYHSLNQIKERGVWFASLDYGMDAKEARR